MCEDLFRLLQVFDFKLLLEKLNGAVTLRLKPDGGGEGGLMNSTKLSEAYITIKSLFPMTVLLDWPCLEILPPEWGGAEGKPNRCCCYCCKFAAYSLSNIL